MMTSSSSPILVNGEPVRYDLVPVDYMRGGVEGYIEYGIEGGDFLNALVSNDLFETLSRADYENTKQILNWCRWFHNYAPPACYGSHEKVRRWIDSRLAAYTRGPDDEEKKVSE